MYKIFNIWQRGEGALIKKETKFSSYIRKFRWDRVQSHIWRRGQGFPIYEEMRKFFTIYEEAVSHIWLCKRSLWISLYMRKILFDFLSVWMDGLFVEFSEKGQKSRSIGKVDQKGDIWISEEISMNIWKHSER